MINDKYHSLEFVQKTIVAMKIQFNLLKNSRVFLFNNIKLLIPKVKFQSKNLITNKYNTNIIVMRIVIQLIESYLKQEIPSILITTDTNKYLFNVPPSFQRFTRQNRIKYPVAANYFFTKSSTNTITGLTGLLLTMYDKGASCGSKLYLDDKLFQYMQELRYKMGFKISPISYCTWQGRLRSGISNYQKILSMHNQQNFVQIFDDMQNFINKQLPPKDINNSKIYLNAQSKHFQNDQMKIKPFFIFSNGQQITNFIVTPKPLQGRILKEKMEQYGLKSGKDMAQLIKVGKIVINGRQILLEQLKQPDSKSPNILILHYNSIQSITCILAHQTFRMYAKDKDNFTFCLVHIVQDPKILKSEQYKMLIKIFDLNVEHLIYNRQYKNKEDSVEDLMCLSAQLQLVSGLSKMFPMCMPNLQQKFKKYIQQYVCNQATIQQLFPQNKVIMYKKCYEMVVSPKKGWGYKPVINQQKKKIELNKVGDYEIIDLPLQESIASKVKICNPRIIFLGTGSMKPSKYRNVSSILVQIDEKNSIVLDCGEGTHIQIAQHFGFEQYQESLLKIRIIFITHIHSDHNLGILDLISHRNKILQKRGLDPKQNMLFLILPANVVPWFESFCRNIENLKYGCSVVFIQSLRNQEYDMEGTMSKEKFFNKQCPTKSQMVEQSQENQGEQSQQQQLNFSRPEWANVLQEYGKNQKQVMIHFFEYLKKIKIIEFKPCPVIHCPQSYGIVFTHQSQIKISYSGDTRPCQEFAQAALGSTIMIHEATFGDDLQSNASSHFHSTVGEAIDIGMKSKSWKTALTHFSQRYKSASDIIDPRMYKLNEKKYDYAKDHTIVCYDHLQVKVSEAHLMPYYSKILALAMPKDGKE